MWLNERNRKDIKPACQRCYEIEIQTGVDPEWPYPPSVQQVPGTAMRNYHGSGWRE